MTTQNVDELAGGRRRIQNCSGLVTLDLNVDCANKTEIAGNGKGKFLLGLSPLPWSSEGRVHLLNALKPNLRAEKAGRRQPLLASLHPPLWGRDVQDWLLVFLARPLAVQCSGVKIAGVEGTALTLLLSASTSTPDQAPPGLGAMAFHSLCLALSHL